MFFGLPRFLPSFGGKNFQSWNLVRFHEARFCSTHDVSNCAQTQSVNQVVSGSVTDQVGSVFFIHLQVLSQATLGYLIQLFVAAFQPFWIWIFYVSTRPSLSGFGKGRKVNLETFKQPECADKYDDGLDVLSWSTTAGRLTPVHFGTL